MTAQQHSNRASRLTMEAGTVSPWFEAAVIKYGWIWVGVAFGFGAKYGLIMKRGKPITARMIVADALMIGIVALVAYWIVSRMGVDHEAAALVTALVAVGADRGVQRLTDRFWQQVETAMPDPVAVKALERELQQMRRSDARLRGEADFDSNDSGGLHVHHVPQPKEQSE